jgi:hypothetical protein
MPAQQGVRCDQSVELPERLASKLLCGCGEPTSLGVRESKTSTAQLLAEHRVLGDEVLRDALMIPGHPPGKGQQ